jgi:hypothetical protein
MRTLCERKKVAQRYNNNAKPHPYLVGDTVVYRLNLVSSKALNVSAKLLLEMVEACSDS